MSLEPIAARTRQARAADAELPVVRLDADADAGGLVAWFGEDAERKGARLVIRGEDVGVLERTALYDLVAGRTLGWGDSLGATLPGDPTWEPIELRCPVAGCPQSPAWVLSYDPEAPPDCAVHAGTTLMPAT